MDKLVVRSEKCLYRHGDYVEKQCFTPTVTSHKHSFAGTFSFLVLEHVILFSDRSTYDLADMNHTVYLSLFQRLPFERSDDA